MKKVIFRILTLTFFFSSTLEASAQSNALGDRKLQRLILKQAEINKSQGVLQQKRLVIDWEKYSIEDPLANTWLSLSKFGEPINLGLSAESQAYLIDQFKAQQSGNWVAPFLDEINKNSKTESWYAMSKPVFDKKGKMVFIGYGFPDGENVIVYRKHRGKWKRFATLQLWGT